MAKSRVGLTIVAVAYISSIDDGFPLHQVALIDWSKTFDALLFLLLCAPCIQLLYQSSTCASRRSD